MQARQERIKTKKVYHQVVNCTQVMLFQYCLVYWLPVTLEGGSGRHTSHVSFD